MCWDPFSFIIQKVGAFSASLKKNSLLLPFRVTNVTLNCDTDVCCRSRVLNNVTTLYNKHINQVNSLLEFCDIQDQSKTPTMQKSDNYQHSNQQWSLKWRASLLQGSVEWEKCAPSDVKHGCNTLNDTTGYCLYQSCSERAAGAIVSLKQQLSELQHVWFLPVPTLSCRPKTTAMCPDGRPETHATHLQSRSPLPNP